MQRLLRLGKSRFLALIFVFLIGAFVLAGQQWYSVSMTPNDEAVTIRTFDGYSCYTWISPLLLVCLAAFGTSSISSGVARFISLFSGAISSISLAFFSAVSIAGSDLSGISKEIESATGIAASHGAKDLSVTLMPVALLSVAVFAILGGVFLVAALSQKYWPDRATPVKRSKPLVQDPISLWDEQR